MPENNKQKELDNKAKYLLFGGLGAFAIATVLIISLPLLVTNLSWLPLSVSDPNEIGDTLGGIMGPVVALLGVLLTFLAFWAQYVANQAQRQQFLDTLEKQDTDKKEQQFESHFFEMLRLHKENVDELKISSLLNKSPVEKRMVFETMANEFKELLSRVEDFNSLDQSNYDRCV